MITVFYKCFQNYHLKYSHSYSVLSFHPLEMLFSLLINALLPHASTLLDFSFPQHHFILAFQAYAPHLNSFSKQRRRQVTPEGILSHLLKTVTLDRVNCLLQQRETDVSRGQLPWSMYLNFGNLKSEKSHHKITLGIKIVLVDFGVLIFFNPLPFQVVFT